MQWVPLFFDAPPAGYGLNLFRRGLDVAWIVFALSLLVAAALLIVPGHLLVSAFGVRLAASLSLSPVVSVALYSVLAIVYGLFGIIASPATLFLPIVIAGLALHLVLGRRRRVGQTALLDVSEELSGEVWGNSKIATWPVISIGAALLSALLVAVFVFLCNVGSPDTFLNNYDIAFHLSRVREFMDGGNYSSLAGGFYPSAWHCVAAMVCSVTGCSVPSAVLSSITAFVVLVFPLGTYYFLATLFPDKPRRVFLGCLFCLCIAFFPWRIMLFGPLYPNVASFSLMPAVAALFIRLFGPREQGEGRALCAVLFVLGGISLTLAQPNTVFFAALYLVPYCMYRIGAAVSGSAFARGRRWPGVALAIAFLAVFVVAWAAVLSTPYMEPLVAYERATPVGVTKAINRLLTFQFVIWRPQYLLFLVTAVGGLALLLKGRSRWALVSYGVLGAVYVVSISVGGPIRGYISGFCYNDYYRTAAAVCAFATPLVASGLDCIVGGVQKAVSAVVKRAGRGEAVLTRAAMAASVTAIALIVGFNYFPLFDIPRFASWGFDAVAFEVRESYTNEGNHYFRQDESDFADRAREIVGESLVVNQPYDGSVFSYACNDLHVLFSAFGPVTDEDERLVMSGLNRVSTDPLVREAVERLGVSYVIQLDQGSGPMGMNPSGTTYDLGYEAKEWSGINDIRDDTPGFTLLLSKGDMRLYQIDR